MRHPLIAVVVCVAVVAFAACGGSDSEDADTVDIEVLDSAYARVEESHAAYKEESAQLRSLLDAHLTEPSDESGVAVVDQTCETVTASRIFLDHAREFTDLADRSGYLDDSDEEESRGGHDMALLHAVVRLQTSQADPAEALEQHIQQLQEQLDALTSTGGSGPQDLLEIGELEEQLSEATSQLAALLKVSYDQVNSVVRNMPTQ